MSQVSGLRLHGQEGQPDQEKVARWNQKRMWRERNVKDKDIAINGCDDRSARLPSYRLFIFFIAFPPFETSVTRLAQALVVCYSDRFQTSKK